MKTITTIVNQFITFINTILIPLIFAIAVLVFLWGVYKFLIAGATDPKSHEEGRKYIIGAIIGFAIMVSVWGLVNLLTGTFSLDNSRPCIPTFKGDCATTGTNKSTDFLSPDTKAFLDTQSQVEKSKSEPELNDPAGPTNMNGIY